MRKLSIWVSVLLLIEATAGSTVALASEFDQICKPVLSNGSSQVAGSGDQQKLQYCQAAAGAQSGATSNSVLWKLWAGVAAVCTTACLSPLVGPVICTGSMLGATVTDAAVTRSFTNALVGIGGVAGATLVGKSSGTGLIKSKGSCIAAATATLQSMTHHRDMSNEQSQVAQNVADARALGGGPGVAASTSAAAPVMASQGDLRTGGSPASPSVSGGSDSQAQLDLAVASGKIPSAVADPQFQKDFKSATGKDLSDFLKQSPSSPASAIQDLLDGTLSPTDSSKLASALDELKQGNAVDPSSGISGPYPVAKVGGIDSSNGEEMDFSKALSGLLGQFKGPDQSKTGQNTLEFKHPAKLTAKLMAGRSPASIEEDRSISIFERVTFRYSSLGERLAAASISTNDIANRPSSR